MYNNYSIEKNVQILIALLKANGIKRVIASPGTSNVSLVRSLQNDPYFEMFSAVDERSAAYMACGLAAETGEPVVLSCTGATSSRNYFPGLTEAFYRKLPILAVTSSVRSSNIGHLFPQVTDRNSITADVVKDSFLMQVIRNNFDWNDCEIKANKAILELKRNGGGPVHINLEVNYNNTFEVTELPNVRVIDRITAGQQFPEITAKKVGVFIGTHVKFNKNLITSLERFCATNNAVVFKDHTSGYNGKYAVQHSLVSSQDYKTYEELKPDLTIHIGEISGDYSANQIIGKQVWRVSEDGEIRDTFSKLTKVFEMREEAFFDNYSKNDLYHDEYLKVWEDVKNRLYDNVPELPFSNIWIAKKMHNLLPENSTIHFGILNSLRSWNFFDISETIDSASNVGGFGIDGTVSSLIGASFSNENKLYFGVFGDLSFFYDLNSIGNRHVNNNLRILLVNNGVGQEFRHYNNIGGEIGESATEFIAAKGHFGNQSRNLIKNYSENLGFEYITASNKNEFEMVYEHFLSTELLDKPIVLEVFTNEREESDALEMIRSIEVTTQVKRKDTLRKFIGQKNIKKIEKIKKIKKLLNEDD